MSTYLSNAEEHISLFVSRNRTRLQAMRDSAQDASKYFLAIMEVKDVPSLGEQILIAAFQTALAAVPATLAMQVTWKMLFTGTPKFFFDTAALEKIIAVQENIGKIAELAAPVGEVINHEDYVVPDSLTGFMLRVDRAIMSKINKGIAALAREETLARTALSKLRSSRQPSQATEAALVHHVGPLPDEINEHFLNALPYAYLYEIFRAYTAKSVKVRDLMGPVGPPYTTVSGLNDAQLEHIYALFGTAAHRQRDQRIMEKQQQVLVDAVINAVRAKSGQRRAAWSATMSKVPRLSQPSISNPKDLVNIWRATYRVEYVGGGV